MRFLILAAVVLCSCAKQEPPPPPQIAPGVFTANHRDGLCIAGQGAQRGGLIVYGPGNQNCSVSGPIAQDHGDWVLRPAGDDDCRIALQVGAGTIALGAATPACAYYCGADASFAGKSFKRIEHFAKSPTDLAGDPLC